MSARLTPRQREALDALDLNGSVIRSNGGFCSPASGFHGSTLESLVAKGLAEWDDSGYVWARIVKPGGNEERRAKERAVQIAAANARQARINELAADPVALATALVDLEESAARR